MKIAIVGCGNMGMAFAHSFLKLDLVDKKDLLFIEKSEDRCEALRQEKNGIVVNTIGRELGAYDLLILSVKPQDFASLAPSLREVVKPHQVVLSIMAGITMQKIEQLLNHSAIVRAMPNTPAMLGEGITAFVASEAVEHQKLRKIENLINATGRSIYLEDETMIDAVTALSASGPAYFFYLVKAMIDAGKEMGFDDSMASILVKQTMIGSYYLMQNSEKDLDELIKAVASKGGTTEAALKRFEEGNLAKDLIEGIHAAQRRATELSK